MTLETRTEVYYRAALWIAAALILAIYHSYSV